MSDTNEVCWPPTLSHSFVSSNFCSPWNFVALSRGFTESKKLWVIPTTPEKYRGKHLPAKDKHTDLFVLTHPFHDQTRTPTWKAEVQRCAAYRSTGLFRSGLLSILPLAITAAGDWRIWPQCSGGIGGRPTRWFTPPLEYLHALKAHLHYRIILVNGSHKNDTGTKGGARQFLPIQRIVRTLARFKILNNLNYCLSERQL